MTNPESGQKPWRLRLILPLLSLLLLAAHSLRWGDGIGILCWLTLAVLTISGRGWARLVVGISLLSGVVLWGHTTIDLLHLRVERGLPWERLLWIMGGVAGLTLLAGLVLLDERTKPLFPVRTESAGLQAAAFLLTAGWLHLAAAKAKVPLLLADRFFPGSGRLEMLGLAIYAAVLLGFLLEPARSAHVRTTIWRLFSAVFFGQLLLGLAGCERLLMTGKLHLPVPALIVGGPIYRGQGFFMPILYGITLVLVGGAWCSFLCYIGPWDDVMSRRRRIPNQEVPAWVRWGRVITLLLTIGAAWGLKAIGAGASTAVILGGMFGMVGVGVMGFASSRQGIMMHCTGYCPIGLLSNTLGRLNPFRIRIDEACDRCGACSSACRYAALTPGDLEANRPGITCTLCGDCLSSCARGRLSYRFPWVTPEVARTGFLLLVTVLHTLFLGVARL